jgi:hypothetical protein
MNLGSINQVTGYTFENVNKYLALRYPFTTLKINPELTIKIGIDSIRLLRLKG